MKDEKDSLKINFNYLCFFISTLQRILYICVQAINRTLNFFETRKYPKHFQYLLSIGLVLISAIACFYSAKVLGYTVIALILLMTVSFIAMLFDILPVLVAAVLSAVIWNFFFIPPIYTFHINNAEDALMFSLYFLIALVNVVLTFKIRQAEKKSRDKEEKENTIKLYNTLLNSLSHELRTPISTIIGAVDTLKENGDQLPLKTQVELLNEIEIAGMRLNRQVENLLNMSRLESGILKPKNDWFDLNEVINDEIRKVSIDEHKTVVFPVNEQLPYFKLDLGLIQQILNNLLNNAVLYTPKKALIRIEVKHELGHCIITISDNGKGIPEEEMNRIFDKFHRLPNSSTGGSGLGLSIVKGFVEAQNGEITVTNNAEGGATFQVRIPAETSYIINLKNE